MLFTVCLIVYNIDISVRIDAACCAVKTLASESTVHCNNTPAQL
jgi:hypothetical protein